MHLVVGTPCYGGMMCTEYTQSLLSLKEACLQYGIKMTCIFLGNESRYTLPIGLTFFQSSNSYDIQFNLLMAASTLVVLPVIVLFLLFQKSFIGGISVGSIK